MGTVLISLLLLAIVAAIMILMVAPTETTSR